MKTNYVLLFLLLINLILIHSAKAQNFKEQQMKYPRVKNAIKEKESILKSLFKEKQLSYPSNQIFIRIFKQEAVLELWIKQSDRYQKLKDYKICSTSGKLGPKRQQGDGQIPEGFYYINGFNPNSRFHLSLRINYPNQSDKILGKKDQLGGDIFIHGSCVTIGCIPITDDGIKELYLIAVEAKSLGQTKIPVHIFPTKLNEDNMKRLEKDFSNDNYKLKFWLNLKEGFDFFENNRILPKVTVSKSGQYVFSR